MQEYKLAQVQEQVETMREIMESVYSKKRLDKNLYIYVNRRLQFKEQMKMITQNHETISKTLKEREGRSVVLADKQYGQLYSNKYQIFGNCQLIELLDKEYIEHLIDSLQQYLNKGRFKNIMIDNSLGGSFLFYKTIYEKAHYLGTHPLIINTHVYIDDQSRSVAEESFASFIKDDVLNISSIGNQNIEPKFIIFEQRENKVKSRWLIQDIQKKPGEFIGTLMVAIRKRQCFYLKVYLKIRRVNDYHQMYPVMNREHLLKEGIDVNTDYQYVKFYKYYSLHSMNQGQIMNVEYIPYMSMVKDIFIGHNSIEMYQKYYPEPKESYSAEFTKFLYKKYQSSSFVKQCWELLYMNLLFGLEQNTDQITGQINVILTSNYEIKVLQKLIIQYLDLDIESFGNIIYGTQYILVQRLKTFLKQEHCISIKNIKPMIANLIDKLSSNHVMSIDWYNYIVLNKLRLILFTLAMNQIIFNQFFARDLNRTIHRILEKIYDDLRDFFDFDVFDSLLFDKESDDFVNVDRRVMQATKYYQNQGKQVDSETVECQIKLSYIKQYNFIYFLYSFYQDYFFDTKEIDVFASFQQLVNQEAISYQLQQINHKFINQVYLNKQSRQQILQLPFKYSQEYHQIQFFAEKQGRNELIQVYGLKNLVLILDQQYIVQIQNLFNHLSISYSNRNINNKQYQITDVFTMMPLSLLNNSMVFEQDYFLWEVGYDMILRGPNYENSMQLFIECIISYCLFLQSFQFVFVQGIYTMNNEYKMYLKMSQIMDNKNSQTIREKLMYLLVNKQQLYLTLLVCFGGVYKTINIYLSMHFINSNTGQLIHQQDALNITKLIRTFFSKDDLFIWLKIYQITDKLMYEVLDQQIIEYTNIGENNKAIKLIMLKKLLQSDYDSFNQTATTLYNYSEIFHLLYQSSRTLYYVMLEQYNQNILEIYDKKRPKIRKSVLINQYQQFEKKALEYIFNYQNIQLEMIWIEVYQILLQIRKNIYLSYFNYTLLIRIIKMTDYFNNAADLNLFFQQGVFEQLFQKSLFDQ